MRALAVATALCFAVAGAARMVVVLAPGLVHRGAPATNGLLVAIDLVAGTGACAAGTGVLCFGATLVALVLRHRGARMPISIGVGAVVLALGAACAGVLATQVPGLPEAAGLSVLRTALAGLAAASLPAVALGALRSRVAHRAA